ncbi:uncharacterized protein LOC115879469 [Sitophilus oryzae]|uniref:Uncharacterized protein LOC115879469 n=1 Tax=Sitophilus oryzae TaxID=7048 RepID=A0A6J2XMZ8_SITOR|nr:uncharacterized protein LOC115879469 [Sitophilus oryzae]
MRRWGRETRNSDLNHRNGVGFIVRNNIKKSTRNLVGFSDRIILLQRNASPTNINLIQIYAPTADKQDEEAEELYGQTQEVLRSLKPHEITIILGDFNAKVGKGRVDDVAGAFGLGERNGRGELLLHFCKEENMVIKNTFYKLHPQRLKLISEKRTTTQRHYNIDRLRDPAVADRMKFELTELWASNNNNPGLNDSPDGIWNNIKQNILTISNAFLTPTTTKKNKPWMTNEIRSLMEDRRIAKVEQQQQRYTEINKTIKQQCQQAKENWVIAECQEAERMHALHDSVNFQRKVKQITDITKKAPIPALKHNGKLILDPVDLCSTWKSYAQLLFEDQREDRQPLNCEDWSGPEILESEVQHAMKVMKNRKSPGHDNVHAEVLKIFDSKHLTYLFNRIYDTGKIPNDWLKSTFITIPKKVSPKDCSDYRLISLML